MKAAVYAATRNMYDDMLPSIKSLLINSDVEKIYMLIEDDIFPHDLPKECETINVSDQRWFPSNGVNYNTKWSYMILMRAAYTKLFTDLDVVLSLDCDTIVAGDISDIWNINLDGYYFAAVEEPYKTQLYKRLYTCIGVTLFNLKMLRENGMDDKIIADLNNTKRSFPEQDSFNECCQGYILNLHPMYGRSLWTTQCDEPLIEHFAASNGEWKNYEIVNYYRNIPFTEIRKED